MKVAIYARVSTKDQTAENQLQDLRRYCGSRGWEISKEFVDHAISGTKDDRPALRELMDCARKRLVDAVLVWRFDRFARSVKHLVNALAELNELGIDFVSYSEALDTSTSQGRLMFHLLGLMAEFERDLIVERINAGLRRAKAEGKEFGRPWPKLNAEKIRYMRELGASLRQIGREFGVTAPTILRVLSNPSRNYETDPVGTDPKK